MPTILGLAFDERLECDLCGVRGTEVWARDHADETGHPVFTVVTI